MELTAQETRLMELYNNYSGYYNDLEFRRLDEKWTSDGTKESTWISIYNKTPIDTHINQLLFVSSYDEKTIVNEMESFITNNSH
jgi:hypothetical protein